MWPLVDEQIKSVKINKKLVRKNYHDSKTNWYRGFKDKNQNVLAIDISKSSVQNPKYSQYSMIKEYENKITTVQKAPFKLIEDELITLRIFIDKSIIEVFVNDGAQSITQVVYPSLKSSNRIEVFSDDTDIEIKKINAWKLFPTMQW